MIDPFGPGDRHGATYSGAPPARADRTVTHYPHRLAQEIITSATQADRRRRQIVRRHGWSLRLAVGNAILAAWLLLTVACIVFALLSWIWPIG